MISGLPVTLAQLKAEKHSEKLKNEIRFQCILCTVQKNLARKNIKSAYNSNKFKISALPWNDEFDLPDGYYLLSDIQVYLEYIFKKDEIITDIIFLYKFTSIKQKQDCF